MNRNIAFVFFALTLPALAFADPATTAACPDLSALQRAAGYLSWLGLLKVIGSTLLLGGVGFIFRGAITYFLEQESLLEFLAWSTVMGLIIGAYFAPMEYQTWMILPGSGILSCVALYSAHVRKISIRIEKSASIITVIWGAIAVFYQSDAVGFLAVGALLTALGYSIVVTPLSYGFGFTSDDAMPRATAAGLLVTAAYVGVHIADVHLKHFAVFETGALWLGCLVLLTGLLIMSSSYYHSSANHVFFMNVLMIAVMAGGISLGAVYGIREISTICGAFLLFYGLDKIFEVRTADSFTFGLKLIIMAGVVALVWHALSTHADFYGKMFMYL